MQLYSTQVRVRMMLYRIFPVIIKSYMIKKKNVLVSNLGPSKQQSSLATVPSRHWIIIIITFNPFLYAYDQRYKTNLSDENLPALRRQLHILLKEGATYITDEINGKQKHINTYGYRCRSFTFFPFASCRRSDFRTVIGTIGIYFLI